MGGFGFGMLADVQMLGYYQALHAETHRAFLAYVLQIETTLGQRFLVYRRYSQIAALSARLHFHPAVGLPPKYALQVFPLTEEQLAQRLDGLRAFISEVFATLARQHADGLQHDVHSTAGLDMQIFYDFVAHQRNRPPTPVKTLPSWASPRALSAVAASSSSSDDASASISATTSTPLPVYASASASVSISTAAFTSAAALANAAAAVAGGPSEEDSESRFSRSSSYVSGTPSDVGGVTWQDVESIGSEEVHGPDAETDGATGTTTTTITPQLQGEALANEFRNELLQAEGTLNAFWNCVKTYESATLSWWTALGAVVDEYKRITDLPLFHTSRQRDGTPIPAADDPMMLPPARLLQAHQRLVDGIQEQFDAQCKRDVVHPVETLVGDVLPEIKHSYWTRLSHLQQPSSSDGGPVSSSSTGSGSSGGVNTRRLMQEREVLHERIRADAQASMMSLLRLQDRVLKDMQRSFEELHAVSAESTSPVEALSINRIPKTEQGDSRQAETQEEQIQDQQHVYEEGVDDISNGADRGGDVKSTALELDDLVGESASSEQAYEHKNGSTDTDALPSENLVLDDAEREATTVWVWGRAPKKDTATPLLLRPKKTNILPGQHIVQIACGGEHLLYLTHTGDVYTFGDSDDRKASAGANANTSVNTSSSTLSTVPVTTPTTPSFMLPRLIEEFALEKALHHTKIVQIACGAQHSVGLTDVGEVYSWGSGEDGRLGHGDMRDRSVPRKIMSLLRHRVLQASCGGAHTAVLTDHGSVFTFGRGRNGRLGLGDAKWRDTPQQVGGLLTGAAIAQVVCGWNFTVARALDGRVFSWGKQGEGQCGLGYVDRDQLVPRMLETLRDVRIIDLACGYTHTLALSSHGDVFSWGLGEYGQLGRGIVYQPMPDLIDFSSVLCAPDRVQHVHCGAFHSVVTTEARVMFGWGLNLYGACGLGHTVNKDTPERIDSFQSGKDLVVACGHKYTIAIEVDPTLREELLTPDEAVTATTAAARQRQAEASTPTRLQVSVAEAILAPDWSHTLMIANGVSSPPSTSPLQPRDTIHEKEEELRRAKKLWRTRILRDWEECKDTPLAHAMWRQGIPPTIRARVWPLAIGNKLKITPDMYQIYRKRAIAYKQERLAASTMTMTSGNGHASTTTSSTLSPRATARVGAILMGKEHTLALIDTDLPRTFPSLKLFDASGPYYEFLLEVLETYACYRPDLGYIQGMSYLAALLCLHMPHDRYLAFQCLANLMVNEHLFTFYLLDAELSAVYYAVFDDFLAARAPDLHRHLQRLGVQGAMYLMNWLQTLFLQVLPLEVAARVVDNFLLDGTVFLFRTALAIHELLRDDLLKAELEEAMPMLQRSHVYQDLWLDRVSEQNLFAQIAQISVPIHIYSALDRVVNDVFFFDKRKSELSAGDAAAATSGGQSVGIGRVQNERRRMYTIGDTLNGVLGGF